jgi:Fic family protein
VQTSYNPNIAYNQLPILPPDIDFDDIEILKAVIKTSDAVKELDGQLQASYNSYLNSRLLLRPFFIPEAVASSGIENIITTTNEIFQARALPISERTSVQKETLNYEEALSTAANLISKNGFFSTNDIIALQAFIVPQKKGLRTIPGYKLMNDITGEVFYTPPEGEKNIKDLLSNFDKYFNEDKSKIDPLIRMAIMHYQFEAIHPFKDGNGRLGRLLMPLFLVRTEKIRFPLLFLSEFIINHKSEYYKLLRRVTSHNEWKPWVLFILKAAELQAKRTSTILRSIRVLELELKDEIKEKLPKFRRLDAVDFMFTEPVFTIEQFSDELGILSRNTSSKYLSQLVEIDVLKVEKFKTSKLFINHRMIEIIENTPYA